MIPCVECGSSMKRQQWTKELDILICDECCIKRYFNRKTGKILTHEEYGEIKKNWGQDG